MNRRKFMKAVATGAIAATGVGAMVANAKTDRPERSNDISSPWRMKNDWQTLIGRSFLSGGKGQEVSIECHINVSRGLFENLFQNLKKAGKVHFRYDVNDVIAHVLGVHKLTRIGTDVVLYPARTCSSWKSIDEIRQEEAQSRRRVDGA